MARVSWLLFILWSLVSLHASAVRALIAVNDQTFIDTCVEQHNKFRSEVIPPASDMFAMTWDEGLAKSAIAWTKTCIFKHNPQLQKKGGVHPIFFPIGESVFISTGSFNANHAIKRWYQEVVNYDYSTNTCKSKKVCGHYTQEPSRSVYTDSHPNKL
ncbi:hypothetical protein scyTo_0002091 [Scyliorhinus torazame]|uniref:SCP domain-containing protein n=1 Tax=Scyliorhinus torazame TaxID=75743 RepID=A0A401PHK7_SCYTO|nr:hypothetical protein [Scyliorhinus torazame]